MVHKIRCAVVFLTLLLSVAASAQVAGSYDYSLGGSSMMRSGVPSALFLNPGELARIHEKQLSLSTNRFSELSQISVVQFFPFVGTLGAGIGHEAGRTQYSIGYGKIFSDIQTIGGAINILKGTSTDMTLSIGTSFHFLEEGVRNSGALLGASIVNFSSNTSLPNQWFRAGGGYWVAPNRFCVQGVILYHDEKGKFLAGAEYLLQPDLAFQVGTKAFDDYYAGVTYTANVMRLDGSVGHEGLSFTVTIRLSEDARTLRDNYYDRGMKSYRSENYPDAQDAFRHAIEYDEYYSPARTYVNLSEGITETSTQLLLREAKQFIDDGKYFEAKKKYNKVLMSYPNDAAAKQGLLDIQPMLHTAATAIFQVADGLMEAGNFDSARTQYLLAFEYDSEDESILKRLSSMEKMIADTISLYLQRGSTYLSNNQLDPARRAYEKVLRYDPNNTEASKYLPTIRERIRTAANATVKPQRTTSENFEKGKAAFDGKNYLDAITYFTDCLKQEPKNSEAQSYIDRSREILRPQMESFFKLGLQYYVDEQYKKAIEVWSQALLVDPEHKAILEYKKRAELKLEALERLR